MTDLRNLGQQVYDTVFRNGRPLPHVAFRSYAKGVVDTAVNAKCAIKFGKGKITPPYSSRWIGSLPSLRSLCKKFGGESYDDNKTGGRRIYHSITDGDFRAYEMGCAWDWSVRKIGCTEEPFLLTYKRFKSALGYNAKESFDVYERALSDDQQEKRDIFSGLSSKRRSPDSDSAEKDLLQNLDVAQTKFFRRIQPDLKRRDWHSDETHEQEFLQRWLLHRVSTLGWTHQRFNEFDSGSFGHSREAYKAERIGKKYQWIALQEICARQSDNFEFVIDTYRSNSQERLNGWWMSDFRDIDPSNLLASTFDHLEEETDSCWWVTSKYDSWLKHGTKLGWLKATDDLPNPVELLSVLNPSDQTEWSLLQGVIRWSHEEKLGSLETKEPESQNLLYSLTSYLVKAQDLPRMWNWFADQNWENENWPNASARVHYCLHEHFQLPAFDKVVENEWIVDAFYSRIVPPCPIMLTNDEYLAEKSTHDCSIANTFNIRLPSQWIAENMHLKMGARNASFFDAKGNLISFDPSTSMHGPSCEVSRGCPLGSKCGELSWNQNSTMNPPPNEHAP